MYVRYLRTRHCIIYRHIRDAISLALCLFSSLFLSVSLPPLFFSLSTFVCAVGLFNLLQTRLSKAISAYKKTSSWRFQQQLLRQKALSYWTIEDWRYWYLHCIESNCVFSRPIYIACINYSLIHLKRGFCENCSYVKSSIRLLKIAPTKLMGTLWSKIHEFCTKS